MPVSAQHVTHAPSQPRLNTHSPTHPSGTTLSLTISAAHPPPTSAGTSTVLLSEVLHHYQPRLVDLHNYSPTLSLATKRTNWQTLNHKVLKKLHLPPLTDSTIQQLAAGQRGAIERLLWTVKQRMEANTVAGEDGGQQRRRGEEKEWFAGSGSAASAGSMLDVEDELVMTSDGRVQQLSLGGGMMGGRAGSDGAAERSKDALIADQRDTIDVLHDRIAKLEQLLQSVHMPPRQLTIVPVQHQASPLTHNALTRTNDLRVCCG